jgi:hypothetical protein
MLRTPLHHQALPLGDALHGAPAGRAARASCLLIYTTSTALRLSFTGRCAPNMNNNTSTRCCVAWAQTPRQPVNRPQ